MEAAPRRGETRTTWRARASGRTIRGRRAVPRPMPAAISTRTERRDGRVWRMTVYEAAEPTEAAIQRAFSPRFIPRAGQAVAPRARPTD